MLKTDKVIVVEGKYDKIKLSNIIDAFIIETNGFHIYKDKERLNFIRKLADERGIIIITDSDSSGFQIRNYISCGIPKDKIKHIYIPDIYGKEKRKSEPSKEGKLGVEGMRPEVLLEALRKAGATFEGEDKRENSTKEPVTKADLFEWGLIGGTGSASRRQALLKRLELPEHLTPNGMLEALNLLYSREELKKIILEQSD